MKLAIIGSRTFNDYEFLKNSLEPIRTYITLIISGGANGADKLGERYAEEFNIPTKIYIPEWNKYGKSAGYLRNHDIINEADYVVAYQVNKSKGTEHSIRLAKSQNKKVKVFIF